MSQRQYLWCGDTVFPNQTAADVITLTATPASVLRGAFGISYAQQWKVGDSTQGVRVLLSIDDATTWKIRIISLTILSATRGTSRLQVHNSSGVLVQTPIFTHTEGRAVHFGFDAAQGRVTIEGGQEEADSSTDGTAWSTADAAMRLGGQFGGADSARGNVSLPYHRVPATS